MSDVKVNSTLTKPEETKDLSDWRAEAFNEFHQRMTDKVDEFPCIFGVEAVTRGTLRYAFIDGADEYQAKELSEVLRDFTTICEGLGKRTSLVVFFDHWYAAKDHKSYWNKFWNLLKEVSEYDDHVWPEGISKTLDDPKFEFSFNGQPMFVVVNTDLHINRASRKFSRVAITFQPRFVFDDIAEGTEKGDAARKVIRARLETYDNVPLPDELGSFGDDTNREWIQYYLDDGDASDIPSECPFKSF